jgi:DNA-binding MarR family transcriptional regulator
LLGTEGERLGLSTAAITALVDRLERIDYAHRLRMPDDRRGILVELTPTGRAEVGTLFELLASSVEAAMDGMTQRQQEAVARFLGRVTTSFERRGEGSG